MEGYAKLAALIGNQPDLAIFRKFSAANALNLAYLQADLMAVQASFAQIVLSDQHSGETELMALGKYFVRLRSAQPGRASRQLEKLQELQAKLKVYNEALLTYHRLCHLPEVDQPNLKYLQQWLQRNEGGSSFLVGHEKDVWQNDFSFDLTSLNRRTGDEDFITRLISGPVLDVFHNIFGDRFRKDFEVRDQFFDQTFKGRLYPYSNRKIQAIISVLSAMLSALLPAMSIYVLSYVQSPSAKRGVILALMTIFSAVMGLVARAKKPDIFAASAAFAAVIVVFIGNSDFSVPSQRECPT